MSKQVEATSIYPFFDALPISAHIQNAQRFLKILENNSHDIALRASKATKTPYKHHVEDIHYAHKTIFYMLHNSISAPQGIKFRPKGRIFIGLSANEPLVVGIVPVIAALLVGNQVVLRSASLNRALMLSVTQLFYESGFPQNIISMAPPQKEAVIKEIQKSDFVFWFGSYQTCRDISKQCIELGIPFAYEAEGYDLAIIDDTLNVSQIRAVSFAIGKSFVRHNGQICQAIRGVFVHNSLAMEFREAMNTFLNSLKVGDYLDPSVDCSVAPQIQYIRKPSFDSAPFSPELWIIFYDNLDEVMQVIKKNPYRLSLSIYSRNPVSQLLGIVSQYKCARLLINDYPEEVKSSDPWGGLGFSGTTGPTDWFEKFVDKTFIRQGNILGEMK